MAIVIERQPDALSAAGNRLYFLVSSDKSGYAGYTMTAKVVVEEPGGTLSEVPVMKLYPNGDGKADLEVGRIVGERLKPVFPALSAKGFTKLSGFTGRFKVVFNEKWNAGTSPAVESAMVTVLKGKFAANQTLSAFVQAGNYLTNGGSTVETVAEGVHYLTALFLRAGSYMVKLKAVYEDGTIENRSVGVISTAGANEVYAIPAGLKHLVFERQVEKYVIWVQNGSGVTVLREVTFRVRRMVKRYRSMLYLNVLGGIDTVVLTDMSETMKTERESYRADRLHLLSVLTDYADTFEATTGYIPVEAAKQNRELVISDRVYVVHSDSLVAVNIEKGSYKLFSENDDLQSLVFKYSFADQDFPVLNDDGGGVEPEPEPEPEPDGKVIACCPDGVDDYFTIATPTAANIAAIFPSSTGMKCVYTLDMIPEEGFTFAIDRAITFALGVMYNGTGLIIQVFMNTKSYLVYKETSENHTGRRIKFKLTVANNGNVPALELLINNAVEVLDVMNVTGDQNFAPFSDAFNLFRSGRTASQMYSNSRIVSFAVDSVQGASVTPKILWDFQGSTDAEKLKNKVAGTAYDLVAKNVTNLADVIKSVSFKY